LCSSHVSECCIPLYFNSRQEHEYDKNCFMLQTTLAASNFASIWKHNFAGGAGTRRGWPHADKAVRLRRDGCRRHAAAARSSCPLACSRVRAPSCTRVRRTAASARASAPPVGCALAERSGPALATAKGECSGCEGRAQRREEGGGREEKSKMLTYESHPMIVGIESDIENGWVRRN